MSSSISTIKRMEIYMADLPKVGGSVQSGKRPVLIVQNDVGNVKSSTVVVVPLTSKCKKWQIAHVDIPTSTGLSKESVALCEQILTVSKECLGKRLGIIENPKLIKNIEKALLITLFIGKGKIKYEMI